MNRAERTKRRDDIRSYIDEGHTHVEAAEKFGLSANYIQQLCPYRGNKPNKGIFGKHKEEIIDMRLKGIAVKNIAEHFGFNYESLRSYLYSTLGVKIHECKNTEEEAARRVYEKSDGKCEYVDGYVNKESVIAVRCLQCGSVVERTYHHITTRGFNCPECARRKSEQAKADREEQRAIKRAEKEKRRLEKAEALERKRRERENPHPCLVCGKLTIKPKYCSNACRDKVHNQSHDTKRRILITTNMIDKDISVEGIFRRDKGICQICGKPCNYNDFIIKDGTFIAGGDYPSVDHIVPLSKGGEHSWVNVRLAHRRCNTLEYKKQSQEFGKQ